MKYKLLVLLLFLGALFYWAIDQQNKKIRAIEREIEDLERLPVTQQM